MGRIIGLCSISIPRSGGNQTALAIEGVAAAIILQCSHERSPAKDLLLVGTSPGRLSIHRPALCKGGLQGRELVHALQSNGQRKTSAGYIVGTLWLEGCDRIFPSDQPDGFDLVGRDRHTVGIGW